MPRGINIMAHEKEVLVVYGERKRTVRFQESPDNPEKERISLLAAVRDTFKDVLEQSEENRMTNQSLSIANMIIQIKSEKWSGEFVDVHGSVVVPDSSVLRLSLNEESKHEVCENSFRGEIIILMFILYVEIAQ